MCNREQMPQMQFRVVTERQIPVQRVQKKIEFPHVQRLTRWSMFLLSRFTGLLHGRGQIVQQHVEVPETQTSESFKSMRQVAPTDMVEKVEMNVAMLAAGVEKIADGELSDLRCKIVSDGERDHVKSYMSEPAQEERSPGLSSNSVYDPARAS